jgi:Fe-Mn family superoxide dismutase
VKENHVPEYTLPDLPYDYAALEPHYSAQIVELHHDKHHAAYVKGANATLEALEAARGSGDFAKLFQLEKNLAFHVSGHTLHSLFWKNLSPDGGGNPEGELAAAVDDAFGSFDACKSQLTQATTSVQGSGWGALSWDLLGGRLVVEQIWDHQDNHAQSTLPLFVIDIWEHAFYLQYQTDKASYVEAIWNLANWSDVAGRLDRVRGVELV